MPANSAVCTILASSPPPPLSSDATCWLVGLSRCRTGSAPADRSDVVMVTVCPALSDNGSSGTGPTCSSLTPPTVAAPAGDAVSSSTGGASSAIAVANTANRWKLILEYTVTARLVVITWTDEPACSPGDSGDRAILNSATSAGGRTRGSASEFGTGHYHGPGATTRPRRVTRTGRDRRTRESGRPA